MLGLLMLQLVVVAVLGLGLVGVVHAARGPQAHDEVLDEAGVGLAAHGLGLGAGEALEAHGELAVALAQLVRAGVAAGRAGLARD